MSNMAKHLKLADGTQVHPLPSKQNKLQNAIIEKFSPRYAPDAIVLYLRDAANKFVIFERERLEQLCIPTTTHDKLPDIILCHEEKNWLYLIEAVSMDDPVSHQRRYELENLLSECTAKRIYISAFPNFTQFRRNLQHIAWKTDVWIAELPEHMIHFNGEHYLEPYK